MSIVHRNWGEGRLASVTVYQDIDCAWEKETTMEDAIRIALSESGKAIIIIQMEVN